MNLKEQLENINIQIEEALLHDNLYVLSNLYVKRELILTELKKYNQNN